MVTNRVIRRVVALVCLIGLAACSMNSISLPAPPYPDVSIYRVDAGDKLSVQVFGQSDLSGQFDVGANGQLSLPLVGTIPARQRSTQDIADDIQSRLANGFVVNPRVSVEVAAYRSIYVLGEVNHAGNFPWIPGMRVEQAVALAGGFTRRAITSKVVLTRQGKDGLRQYGIGMNEIVMPGDTLNIKRRIF